MSQAQTFEIVLETRWDADQGKCYPCDYNEKTAEVIASKTVKIPVRGTYLFQTEIKQISYKSIEFPTKYQKSLLPTSSEVEISVGKSRGENFLIASYQPLINDAGEVKIIDEISVQIKATPNPTESDRAATFASTSVLSSGSWYKIGVSRSGVHKIDQAFLTDMGVNTSSLNPNHINIYGNHVPKLPNLNSAYHPDDLLKNAIHIQGDGDGSFDASDYILFYATGPEDVIYNSNDISASVNKIDSLAYYFIHIDASDSPKRVGTIGNSASASTHTVTKGNEYYLYEKNETNLLKSGDGWIGDHFDIELTKNLTFIFDQLSTADSIQLETQYASNQTSGSSSLAVVINGTTVDNITSNTISAGGYVAAAVMDNEVKFKATSSTLNTVLTYSRTSPASQAWLDYMLFNYKRNLTVSSSQFHIRSLATVGVGNVVQYQVGNASSSLAVWEVTDPVNPKAVTGTLAGSSYSFKHDADSLRQYLAFQHNQALTPQFIKSISNQNLHALTQADYIIVTHSSLAAQANRLADLHRAQGLTVHVVEIQKVYNEFSGGMSDPVAIRWFMKMFYDRAGGDPAQLPQALCLFGDGTYDPLNRLPDNNYLIPTYNSVEAGNIDFIASYTADDFYGILDDDEAISATDLMDIGVGRIPVTTIEEATDVVNKIEHYMNYGSSLYSSASGVECDAGSGYSSTFGDWRTRLVLMADDEDNGTFVEDCETLSDSVENKFPEMNVIKLYLDAYQQVVTSGGQRYPDVEEAINQNMNKGALVFNYVGHGGETGLSLERVVTIPQIQSWTNVNNMPVFISATCEFSRFDDPGRVSAGEITLLSPYGGAVAMLTTTRLVYITVNTVMVQNLYSILFSEENGKPLMLGEILRRTKNASSGSGDNIRSFSLLGDPALRLGKPQPLIVTDSLNGVSVTMPTDTLKALSKITISGHVEDLGGSLLSSYNGIVYPTVYDKKKIRQTLGQDPKSTIESFDSQTNIIYKGKATVKNGRFTFSFVVPKDIDYVYGSGKISYYSNNSVIDNYGYDTSVVVGGVDPNGITDNIGPQIDLYMNDQNFANGGLTDENPKFIAEITDENGINTTGNGIGHDITLIIDGNTADPIILNNFYEADLDTYQSGKVSYPLSDLEEGEHTAVFKVWDVNNNSSEATLDFVVVKEDQIGITHLLNYPNPFTTNTSFFFEHNQVCNSLQAQLEIFTVSGKLVKTIQRTVTTSGFRSEGIAWDGRDDFGDKLARGVYVYRLTIETPDGQKAEKIEKLVLL